MNQTIFQWYGYIDEILLMLRLLLKLHMNFKVKSIIDRNDDGLTMISIVHCEWKHYSLTHNLHIILSFKIIQQKYQYLITKFLRYIETLHICGDMSKYF